MMDNSAFRSLVSQPSSTNRNNVPSTSNDKRPAALGSRARASIPMTPRNVPGYNNRYEFARQVADQTSGDSGPPRKKFKTSSAPKGSRLATGYVDRAAAIRDGDGEGTDDKEERLKALEDMVKLQQISVEDFEVMKSDMGIGGDTSSTHLVKGLDWKLLERVRRGEDVMKSKADSEEKLQDEQQDEHGTEDVDIEDELEKALAQDVKVTGSGHDANDEGESHGEESQKSAQAVSLSRDEILRRLKESRNTLSSTKTSTNSGANSALMAPPPAPDLNSKFKKIAATPKSNKHKFTESVNGRRREILIITLKDGSTKRKTRWLDPEPQSKSKSKPDDGENEAWGMAVPANIAEKARLEELRKKEEEEEDDDIFQGVGADYDPLDAIESDSDSEKDSGTEQRESVNRRDGQESKNTDISPSLTTQEPQKRNYFRTITEEEAPSSSSTAMAKDPTILAALKRAAEIRLGEDNASKSKEGQETTQKEQDFLAKQKERERQDAADLDMDYGFGGSRFDDEEGEDDGIVLEDEEGEKKGKGGGRRRGPKKRKGDKNSFSDVMGVIEGRDKQKKTASGKASS